MQSRYGELLVAVRDGEERVRFLGYDPANIKVVAYTAAALFASIAGALFAPIVGIITPAQVGVVPSIAFLIGVAIGGRATLLGPVLGAIGVAWAQTAVLRTLSVGWTYVQGLLFIVVVGFLPAGLAGLGPCSPTDAAARSDAAPEPEPDPRSGSRAREGGCPRHDHRTGAAGRRQRRHGHRIPRSPRPDRRFRRVQGGRRRRPDAVPGRPALPHRPQRRGQDDADRRDHRAGSGHRVGEQVGRGTAGQEGAPDRPAAAWAGRSRRPASSSSSPCCRTSTSPPGAGRSAWTLLRRAVRRAARRSRRRWRRSA